MVKSSKLHKFFGLSAGLVVLILSITGFFLDHDKWNFLYTAKITSYPSSLKNANTRLFTSYYIDTKNPKYIVVGAKRGLYESYDGGVSFSILANLQINAIKQAKYNQLFFATSHGIYILEDGMPIPFMLQGKYITSMSLYKNTLVAVEDKKTIYFLDIEKKKILKTLHAMLPQNLLNEDIKLSRFIRDLHYGRGLFDGDTSLFINDFGALVLTFLALSGFLIWYLIYKKRVAKSSRRWIRYHANIVTILAVVPVVILLITGVFLDHAKALGAFMKSVTISHKFLPPVYSSLQEDIWSIDYNGKYLRIGNRYGVYRSDDYKHWILENRGFAYSLTRHKNLLFVGGMGTSNRVCNKQEYQVLPKTPHMFKDVAINGQKVFFFSPHKTDLPLPKFQDITLYSLLLSLHDGTFFGSWWIWVNDYGAFAMMLLFMTGIWRWWKKKCLTLT